MVLDLHDNNENGVKEWMASFIKGDMAGSEFKEVYNNDKFTFIISSIEKNGEGSYLISYMPNIKNDDLALYSNYHSYCIYSYRIYNS